MARSAIKVEAIMGALAVAVAIVGSLVFVKVSENDRREEETREFVVTEQRRLPPSELLANKKTLASIFEILKDSGASPDQFDAMLAQAGYEDIPEPPEGLQYAKDKSGKIRLKKLEPKASSIGKVEKVKKVDKAENKVEEIEKKLPKR